MYGARRLKHVLFSPLIVVELLHWILTQIANSNRHPSLLPPSQDCRNNSKAAADLFDLELLQVTCDRKHSSLGDHGGVSRIYREPIERFCHEIIAPDRHLALPVAPDVCAPVNHLDDTFLREHTVVPFGQKSQIGWTLGEKLTDNPVTAPCFAVADDTVIRIDPRAEFRILGVCANADCRYCKERCKEQMKSGVHDQSPLLQILFFGRWIIDGCQQTRLPHFCFGNVALFTCSSLR